MAWDPCVTVKKGSAVHATQLQEACMMHDMVDG